MNDEKFIIQQKNYTKTEREKPIKRTDIINFLLSLEKRDKKYLEIGVRNRKSNFDLIKSKTKYSVDPAVNLSNHNDHFQLTSDDFFSNLKSNKILSSNIKFDVIFVDGLHLAEQVEKDIKNSLEFIKDDGFIVLGVPSNDFMGQEPGTAKEIKQFCELNYGVTFPLTEKIHVKGKNMHDLYRYFHNQPSFKGTISWNFNKILVDKTGAVIKRYGSNVNPTQVKLTKEIESQLAAE